MSMTAGASGRGSVVVLMLTSGTGRVCSAPRPGAAPSSAAWRIDVRCHSRAPVRRIRGAASAIPPPGCPAPNGSPQSGGGCPRSSDPPPACAGPRPPVRRSGWPGSVTSFGRQHSSVAPRHYTPWGYPSFSIATDGNAGRAARRTARRGAVLQLGKGTSRPPVRRPFHGPVRRPARAAEEASRGVTVLRPGDARPGEGPVLRPFQRQVRVPVPAAPGGHAGDGRSGGGQDAYVLRGADRPGGHRPQRGNPQGSSRWAGGDGRHRDGRGGRG